ncbi:MAG: NAD-dependent epimerase/dehydratase family protein [Flavobacteriales bacterium]|nr:NAD-dependent epimerase/dehydratase family protein [Flavobacteriales bacterium]MCB9449110.1 NAD-dependent epimerase/dehydratase family protein [Flavobacteriales bacterium]
MILVTGGTGLLGSHLMYDLVNKGYHVRALRRKGSEVHLTREVFSYYCEDPEALFSKIEWVEGDVLDIFALQDALQGVDQVFHCAAMVSFNPSTKSKMMQVNVEGTANMVNLALETGVKKFGYVSSIAALGRAGSDGGVVTEKSEWKPSADNSMYSVSKYYGEREVWRGIAEGLNAYIINPSVIIGPGNWRRGSASLFYKVWDGLRYYTSGINGFVDVRDVSASMIRLMEEDISNERFIISSENCPYKLVFEWMAEVMGKSKASKEAGYIVSEMAWRFESLRSAVTGSKPLITRETARMANRQYFYSNEKIVKTVGMRFIPVEKAVKDTAEIFLRTFMPSMSSQGRNVPA